MRKRKYKIDVEATTNPMVGESTRDQLAALVRKQ
jgi:hypothetical protein